MSDTPAPHPVDAQSLPHTWRPFGARIAGSVFGGMLLVLLVVVWIAFGAQDRARFDTFQRATLVFLGLLGFATWFALVRSRVSAQERGLTVVNGYRRRDFEWAQVLGIQLRRGAPWANLDLSDGTSISVLAIQGSDGSRAIDAVRALRGLIAEHSAEPPRRRDGPTDPPAASDPGTPPD
ncbi:PH domain-containing protein [Nocardioides terrisoli]|uniref:PH domain-containing protein n=1 Tax=Nocardioides terrisoli TaxID=3388267 RepID=UPI00287B7E1F|nr:PH domain-containing protein [Nocardioides marmorisolisilvae]